jgi:hypothetical protein
VPFEITNMCRRILMNVKLTNDQKLIMWTDIGNLQLKLIIQYCTSKHLNKTTSSIPFPLPQNDLIDNSGVK